VTELTDLNLGYVYFLEEMDRFRDEPSGYYKIGRSGEVGGRIKQHQTGNPRELRLVEEIAAESASDVEAKMHSLLSTRRFNREWFVLRPADLSLVLAATKELAAQQPRVLLVQRMAADLGRVASEGEKLKPDDESTGWWERLSVADCALKVIRELTKDLTLAVLSLSTDKADHLLYPDSNTNSMLAEEGLMREYPALYAKYLEDAVIVGGSARFAPPNQGVASRSLSFDDLVESTAVVVKKLGSGAESVESAHEMFLRLEEFRSFEEREKEICRANLKTLCGVAPGIEGILTWNRVHKSKSAFNTKEFKDDHKELAAQFTTSTTKVTLKLRSNRNYPFAIPPDGSDLQALRALAMM